MKIDLVSSFVSKLKRIGIEVELFGNYPWIYLDTVNGERVTERFMANHGFTAFFLSNDQRFRYTFTDSRKVFEKVREMVEKQKNQK